VDSLLREIRKCEVCKAGLPHGCRPIVNVSPKSKILIIGQVPGRRVHESGIPWDDPSGDNLRNWLNVSKEQFYDADLFGIMPMGFCYPGTGKFGDLPARPECAPLWHPQLFEALEEVKLTLLIGQYAQKNYLKKEAKSNLTETVKSFEKYLPKYLPLPHPSPRNNIWMKKNPWFKEEVLSRLAETVSEITG
jgi:uracil-DNA glycosylase